VRLMELSATGRLGVFTRSQRADFPRPLRFGVALLTGSSRTLSPRTAAVRRKTDPSGIRQLRSASSFKGFSQSLPGVRGSEPAVLSRRLLTENSCFAAETPLNDGGHKSGKGKHPILLARELYPYPVERQGGLHR